MFCGAIFFYGIKAFAAIKWVFCHLLRRWIINEVMPGKTNHIDIYIQYQLKVWTHLLIQGVFFILTIFYIVE